MRIEENNKKFKCPKEDLDYTELKDKILKEAEAEAEAYKQRLIMTKKVDQRKKETMEELVKLDAQKELYGLYDHRYYELNNKDNNENKNCSDCGISKTYYDEKEVLKNSLAKKKEKMMMGLAIIVMLILAIGITPQGELFDFIQESWVELIVDFFRIALLGFGGYLVYKIFKNKE